MTEIDKLPDQELGRQAADWRRRALSGDLAARGIAHQLEAQLRRRAGAVFTSYDTLDLRSLASKQKRPWWRFW